MTVSNEKCVAMRKYKADGHTLEEVAERFSVSVPTASKYCKGVAPQWHYNGCGNHFEKGHTPQNKGVLQDIEIVGRMISERAPNFEYAGNYTGSNGSVDLRCKKCGHVHTHSWWGVRHDGVSVCPNCLEKEKKQKQEEAKRLAIENKINKEIEKRRNERGKQVVRLLTRFSRLHRCPVCGTLTDNKLYCSQKCSAKANESLKDARRRKRIKNGLVDKDINLERLYKKHDGVCAICGGKCDWDDHQYRGRYFIVGKNYPSIDHIIPLSRGGVHSWENVQLAHFGCNSRKGANCCG